MRYSCWPAENVSPASFTGARHSSVRRQLSVTAIVITRTAPSNADERPKAVSRDCSGHSGTRFQSPRQALTHQFPSRSPSLPETPHTRHASARSATWARGHRTQPETSETPATALPLHPTRGRFAPTLRHARRRGERGWRTAAPQPPALCPRGSGPEREALAPPPPGAAPSGSARGQRPATIPVPPGSAPSLGAAAGSRRRAETLRPHPAAHPEGVVAVRAAEALDPHGARRGDRGRPRQRCSSPSAPLPARAAAGGDGPAAPARCPDWLRGHGDAEPRRRRRRRPHCAAPPRRGRGQAAWRGVVRCGPGRLGGGGVARGAHRLRTGGEPRPGGGRGTGPGGCELGQSPRRAFAQHRNPPRRNGGRSIPPPAHLRLASLLGSAAPSSLPSPAPPTDHAYPLGSTGATSGHHGIPVPLTLLRPLGTGTPRSPGGEAPQCPAGTRAPVGQS